MSLSAALDKLSGEITIKPRARQFFNDELIDNWPSKTQELCDQFRNFEGDDERVKWLRELFMELFEVFEGTQLPAGLAMPQISRFLEDICSATSATISGQELTSMVGKMFVSVSSQYADADDAKTVALVRICSSLSREVFKFSRIANKLMINEQTTLLRHLLKKSKYELKKYNLLAECPTGYSQLLILLLTAYFDPDNRDKVLLYVKQMYHVMGKYSLDSMRCLDVILSVSSEFITEQHAFLIDFLKNTSYWPATQLADPFKTEGLHKGGNMVASNVIAFNLTQESSGVDLKYIDMVCILIRHGFVNVLSIWENIRPDNSTLAQFLSDYTDDMEKKSMKGVLNPLAMAAALNSGDDEDSGDAKTQKSTEDSEDVEKSENQDPENNLEESKKCILQSGKVKLLERLLVHGCVTAAFFIIESQPAFVYLESQIPILITRLFEHAMDPLYQSMVFRPPKSLKSCMPVTRHENGMLSHKPRLLKEYKTHDPFPSLSLRTKRTFYYPEWSLNLPLIQSVADLFEKSHEYLPVIGAHLAASPRLICKICRIGRSDIDADSARVENWVNFVRKFIFQSIALLDINPTVTNELYDLMRLFPIEKRYFLYNEMLSRVSKDVLPVKVGFNRTEREAKSILKALSIDTIDEQSRKLANLACTNPLATLMPTVKQIENYDKVSELVVSTTTFFNDFACDVLQYVLLVHLTDKRNAVQNDGVNQSMWVQRLSIFIAGLARDCDKMDITNIKEFIVKTLHNGSVIAVSILRELVSTAGGIRDLNNVNLKLLRMLYSGEPLKRVARKLIFDCRDDNRAQGTKLIGYFTKHNTLSEMIVLLYNLNLKANTQDGHYKILSARCDEMNTLLWSFIELIKHCLKPEEFKASVLPLDVLSNDYHLSTPWIFHIWRDYLEPDEDARDKVIPMIDRAKFEGVDFSRFPREVFVSFWKFSLYYIQFDKSLYDERKAVLQTELSTLTSTKKKNEVSNSIKDLLVSCISHQKKYNLTKQFLEQRSNDWIQETGNDSIHAFFQYCVIPRVLFSPSDAMYSASFLLMAFDVSDLLKVMNIFIGSHVLSTLLFCCTSSEAGNLGIFFAQLLQEMETMRQGKQLDERSSRILYDWHKIITEQTMLTLHNKNYMSIRNGIEFMKHLSSSFPVVDTHIQLLCQTIAENLEQEEREDIKLPSNALLGHLKARLKGSLKQEEFCELNQEEQEARAKLDTEIEEIKSYEAQLENERKQVELRKTLELNKKQREDAEKAKEAARAQQLTSKERTPLVSTKPSVLASPEAHRSRNGAWPLGKVLRFMDELRHNFDNSNLNKAMNCIFDQSEKNAIQELNKQAMPLKDFRKNLSTIVERFLSSLVQSTDNSDFIEKLQEVKHSISHVTRDASKKRSEMYSDAPSGDERVKTRSRYGGSSRIELSGRDSSNGSTKDRRISTTPISRPQGEGSHSSNRGKLATPSAPSKYYSTRQNRDSRSEQEPRSRFTKKDDEKGRAPTTPLAPRALMFPDKPAQRGDSRNGRNNVVSFKPRSQESSNRRAEATVDSADGRAAKRFRSNENRNNYRSSDNRPKDHRKDTDRSRYADRRNQALPQGPRASQEPPSRYQR